MYVRRKGSKTYHKAHRGFRIEAWTTFCGQTIPDRKIDDPVTIVLAASVCRKCKAIA